MKFILLILFLRNSETEFPSHLGNLVSEFLGATFKFLSHAILS